jgi:hypothetical protein
MEPEFFFMEQGRFLEGRYQTLEGTNQSPRADLKFALNEHWGSRKYDACRPDEERNKFISNTSLGTFF